MIIHKSFTHCIKITEILPKWKNIMWIKMNCSLTLCGISEFLSVNFLSSSFLSQILVLADLNFFTLILRWILLSYQNFIGLKKKNS